jgi:hypothetical protein
VGWDIRSICCILHAGRGFHIWPSGTLESSDASTKKSLVLIWSIEEVFEHIMPAGPSRTNCSTEMIRRMLVMIGPNL